MKKRIWSSFVAAFASASLAWAGETAKTTLKIEGMTCGACVPAVKVQFGRTEGVVAYEVSFEKGEAVVSYDPARTTPAKIAESVTRTGYKVSITREVGGAPTPNATAAAAKTGDPTTSAGAPDRVTMFHVPLMCPAVKGLGCGGKARPFMADVEKQPEVAEAWLNHPGTLLAVVWKEPQERLRGAGVVGSVVAPVFQKEAEGRRIVCYCFDVAEDQIRREVEAAGASASAGRIKKLVRDGRCACEVRNPQGACCLGNVAAVERCGSTATGGRRELIDGVSKLTR